VCMWQATGNVGKDTKNKRAEKRQKKRERNRPTGILTDGVP